MNANELADKLESFWLTKNDDLLVESVTMLRQQFDTIADLQTTIKFLEEECKALRNQQAERQEK
jgi:hypothetical protein